MPDADAVWRFACMIVERTTEYELDELPERLQEHVMQVAAELLALDDVYVIEIAGRGDV